MTIDWFTVIAQIINFLILVWLLKRFLYKPILDAIDERERNIVSKIEEANKKESDAAAEREKYIEKNTDFDLQRRKNWEQALQEIKLERQLQLERVRNEASELQQKLDAAIASDQESLMKSLKFRTQQEILSTVRKTLKDLADEDLEGAVVNVFIKKLKKLGKVEKEKLLEHFQVSNATVEVRSAFELQKQQKETLQKTVFEMLGSEIKLNYSVTPDLTAGIELNASNYKISWSIEEYLQSFQRILSEITNNPTKEVNNLRHTDTYEST